jgi:hypothetical protein
VARLEESGKNKPDEKIWGDDYDCSTGSTGSTKWALSTQAGGNREIQRFLSFSITKGGSIKHTKKVHASKRFNFSLALSPDHSHISRNS